MATGNFFSSGESVTVTLSNVKQVATKSSAGGFAGKTLVYDQTEQKFYRVSNSAWTVTTFGDTNISSLADIADVSGTFTDNQVLFYNASVSRFDFQDFATQEAYSSASDLTTALDGTYTSQLVTSKSVSADATLSASDLDKVLLVTGDVTLTLPDSLSNGFQCTIFNVGSSIVDFAAGGTSTVSPSSVELDNTFAGSDLTVATLLHTASGQWYVTAGGAVRESFTLALSDESTSVTTGTSVVTWRAPYAFVLTGVRANVNTAPTGANLIVDINEAGTSLLSTKLSIDATEKTSVTASSSVVINDSVIADDAEVTFDIDQVGSTEGGKGLKVTLIGYQS